MSLVLCGCKMSSFYPVLGATGGATVGSLGGPVGSGGGALVGYGVGKGAQLIDENKDLQDTVTALSQGDVEAIAKKALEKGMGDQEGKFKDFVNTVEKWLIFGAVGLALYLIIPILVARKTATSCSRNNLERLQKEATRPPFPPKPSPLQK